MNVKCQHRPGMREGGWRYKFFIGRRKGNDVY
uniref:Uncharacterized protein n=1 Tax=Myoviridae sp. ctplG2 TaxID=2826700 RepID=A0A8S5LVS6_9CAUD|nr:MAG TPA: hypothetical protein [Myoviridae sp. ctplG2]DAM22400.1 MAG TPA: hypothetical protein [Caudoviricetes sp.]